MVYSANNKEIISRYKEDLHTVYDEYITQNKSTYQLAEEWGIPKSSVYAIVKYHGLVGIKKADKLNTCNESKFNSNDEVFCYLAGLISADGYIDEKNHRVVLRLKYEHWYGLLNKLRDYFEVSNTVKEYNPKSSFTGKVVKMADLTISSKVLIEELKKLNIVGRKKDLLVRFPDMSKLSDVCQEMYIRGLIDGDGWFTEIRNVKMGLGLLEESELMIKAYSEFMSNKFNTDVECRERITKNNVTCYNALITGYGLDRVGSWLYRNNLDYKLEYKYKKLLG